MSTRNDSVPLVSEPSAPSELGEPPAAPIEPEADAETTELSAPVEYCVLALATMIEQFEQNMTDQESTLALFIAPNGETIEVDGFGGLPPDMVYFQGRDEAGRKTMAIVPMGAAALTLKAVPVRDADEEPRRIGFRLSPERPGYAFAAPES